MELKNTKTEENLRAALAGESIARNKYSYFAQAARENGEAEIAAAFEEMAINEMTHARLWYELLYGKPDSVKNCLQNSAYGEYSEWHSMYPKFAEQAREEGLEEVAVLFEHVANIERSHENRFMTMLAGLYKSDPLKVTSGDPEQTTPVHREKRHGYRCQFCGAVFETRPDLCDTCGAIGAFEEVEYYA